MLKPSPLKMHKDRAVIKLHNNLQVCEGDTNFISLRTGKLKIHRLVATYLFNLVRTNM